MIELPRDGWLQLKGYEGRTQQRVTVFHETEHKYRIKALTHTKLGGRNRWLRPGGEALVPKTAVTWEPIPDVPSVV